MFQKIEHETISTGFGIRKGLVESRLGIRAKANYKDQIKNLLNKTAFVTHERMLERVPVGRSKEEGQPDLKSSISYDASTTYKPGGPGGGGFHFTRVGIEPEAEVPHQKWVINDTGPYTHDTFMVFPSESNELVFTKHREGYEAERSWFEGPFAEARIDIQTGIRNFRDPSGSGISHIPA